MASTDRLTLRRPDDWHVHLRDGALLTAVLPYTARQFGRAIVMLLSRRTRMAVVASTSSTSP